MCIAIACWGDMPSEADLERSARLNGHGAGIAWTDLSVEKAKRLVHWQKGLKSDVDSVQSFLKDNKIKYPFVIHYRKQSIGPEVDALTHPFPIDPDARLTLKGKAQKVLFQNGTIKDWEKWLYEIVVPSEYDMPQGHWSDTRALAVAAAIKGEGILRWIRDVSRIVVLDALPSVSCADNKPASHIRLYGEWITPDKAKHSFSQSLDKQEAEARQKEGYWVCRNGKWIDKRDSKNKNLVYDDEDIDGESWVDTRDNFRTSENVPAIDEVLWEVEELEGLMKGYRDDVKEGALSMGETV